MRASAFGDLAAVERLALASRRSRAACAPRPASGTARRPRARGRAAGRSARSRAATPARPPARPHHFCPHAPPARCSRARRCRWPAASRSAKGSLPKRSLKRHPRGHRAGHGDAVPAAHRRRARRRRRTCGGSTPASRPPAPGRRRSGRAAACRPTGCRRRRSPGRCCTGSTMVIAAAAAMAASTALPPLAQHAQPGLRGQRVRGGDDVAREHRPARRGVGGVPVEAVVHVQSRVILRSRMMAAQRSLSACTMRGKLRRRVGRGDVGAEPGQALAHLGRLHRLVELGIEPGA